MSIDHLFGQIVVGAGIGSVPENAFRDAETPDYLSSGNQVGLGNSDGVADVGRGWEAAITDRLNAAHWQHVSSNDNINVDLQTDLQTIQRRARHESINNGLVEGALETHATDVVGAETPRLQLLTDDDAFNSEGEDLWLEWAESCEHQHGLAMVDLLHGFVQQWWTNGEFLLQELVGRRAVDYRLHDLGAEMIDLHRQGDRIVMGVEMDASARVVAYHLTEPGNPGQTTRLGADYAIHAFRRRFSGQLRGIPLLGSNLQTVGDLRDYDDQVLDAARSAADQALWLVTQHPDADLFLPKDPNKTFAQKRRQWRYAPPGWSPMQMESRQPMVQYTDFRTERQREIGRPAQMPLLIVRQDASRHNYSSARFDASGYWRAVARFQSFIGRRTLNKVLRRLLRLASWEGSISPIPDRLRFQWTWPKPPPIDPTKEALAERIRMENGTLSYSQACAANGDRPDEMIQQRQRDNADLIAAELPPIVGRMPLDPAIVAAILNDELGDNNQQGGQNDVQD